MPIDICLKRHRQLTVEKTFDFVHCDIMPKHLCRVCKLSDESYLLFREIRQTFTLWLDILTGVEQMVHLQEIILHEGVFREKRFHKVTPLFKKFPHTADMHHMKPDVCLSPTHRRKMIREEIIHITRVRLFATLDFTLVLLIGSTIELPELILRQLILCFLGTAYTAWTQKERE